DEYFGGFKASATSDKPADPVWRKTPTGWRRRVDPSPWNRVWGRVAIQKTIRRGYKPSRRLEERRFPSLKRLPWNPSLTNDYLDRGARTARDARKAKCDLLVAQFLANGGGSGLRAGKDRSADQKERSTSQDRQTANRQRGDAGSRTQAAQSAA